MAAQKSKSSFKLPSFVTGGKSFVAQDSFVLGESVYHTQQQNIDGNEYGGGDGGNPDDIPDATRDEGPTPLPSAMKGRRNSAGGNHQRRRSRRESRRGSGEGGGGEVSQHTVAPPSPPRRKKSKRGSDGESTSVIQPETDPIPAAQNKRTSSILSLGFSTVLPKRVSGGGRGSIKVMNPAKDHTYHGILLRELNFATHDSVEPRYMFRQARVAKAGFGNFDEEGVPQSINQGEPLSAEAAAWCRQEHSAMGQRRATEAAVVDDVGRVLRGDRELSAKTAKVLAAELRRRDDLKKRVTHPKKMFLGASSGSDDPKAASGLSFRGMFSIWDEIGRPTAGVKVADATVPMTLSQPTIKVLHAAHRLQGQRYIDFYKPKLEAIRNSDPMQHFKVGKYARKFSAWTPDGLPLAYSKDAAEDAGALDAKDLVIRDRNVKRAFAEEMKKVKHRWETDEAKLTTHLHEVALMYNQTTAKAKEGVVGKEALRDVLAAYGMKKQRVATAKALNNGDAGDGSTVGQTFARNSTYARENEAKKLAGTSSSLVLIKNKKRPRNFERRAFIISGKRAGIKLVNDPDTGTLRIGRVLAGSEAEQKGLKDGDRFLSVNDVDYEYLDRKVAVARLSSVLNAAEGCTIMVERSIGTDEEHVQHGGAKGGLAAGGDTPKKNLRRGGMVKGPVGEIRSKSQIWRASMYECWLQFLALPFVCWSKLPPRDYLHAFLESDRWSVAVVMLVLIDTFLSPYRETNSIINTVGIGISVFFFLELSARLYLWDYVRGNLSTFFLQFGDGKEPIWKRLMLLNIVDCVVVFVDILILLVQLAASSSGGSMASVLRLSRLGRVFRYFRLAKNLRSLRFLHLFKKNAHVIYSKLISNTFILFVGVLVMVDVTFLVVYGSGQKAPLGVLLFAIFVSIFFLLELLTRVACHFCVLGELWSFVKDPYNVLDIVVAGVDGIALVIFFIGTSSNAGGIKAIRMLRVLRSLTKVFRWGRIIHVLRTARVCKRLGIVDFLCPVRNITAQQKEDLAIYGVMIEESDYLDEDFNDLGADVKKHNLEDFDDDEVKGAWRPLSYQTGEAVAHLETSIATVPKHGGLGAISKGAIFGATAQVEASHGDAFLYNEITGEVKWDAPHFAKLAAKRNLHTKKRFEDFERRTYIREMKDMGEEDWFGGFLRIHSNMSDDQWGNVDFGGRLPFRHAGRYKIVHRGFVSPYGDGYGRRSEDCYVGQGMNSRSFSVFDTQGQHGYAIAKFSKNRKQSVRALRIEAGVLQSLLQLQRSDGRQSQYFVRLLDSFEVGGAARKGASVDDRRRFGLVFEEHGPSLGFVLSCLARAPSVDEVYDDDGDEDEDEEDDAENGDERSNTGIEATIGEMEEGKLAKSKRKDGRIEIELTGSAAVIGTGYRKRKKRKGRALTTGNVMVPRPPLPIAYTIEITRQLCDACDFLHQHAGMVHGDLTPDNVCFVEPPRAHAEKWSEPTTRFSDATPPWESDRCVHFKTPMECLPASPRIKLVDLGSAVFIPSDAPAKPNFYEELQATEKINSGKIFGSLLSSPQEAAKTRQALNEALEMKNIFLHLHDHDDNDSSYDNNSNKNNGSSSDDNDDDDDASSTASDGSRTRNQKSSAANGSLFKQAQKGSDFRGHNYKADATNVLPSPFATSTAWLEGRSKRASGKQRSAEMTSTDMPATTLNYRAPELDVFEPNWGSVVDCWSIGCILAEMYSGKADMHAGTAKGRVFGSTVDVSAAARSPSFTEIGRGPLFRAETAFEHLAMVERLLGKLPRRIYTRWKYVDIPESGIEEAAQQRVAGVAPSLEVALEKNRSILASDRERRKRRALKRLKSGEGGGNFWLGGSTHGAAESAGAGDGLFSFLGIRTTKDVLSDGEDRNRSAGLKAIQPLEELEAVRRETEICAVEASRSKDMHDLIRRLLATDTEERLTAAGAIAHPALATSVFRNPFL